jgi:hypothetical protein
MKHNHSAKMECRKCKQSLPDDGGYVNCQGCNSGYHFSTCAVAQSTYKGMDANRKRNWRCAECRKEENASGSDIKSDSQADDMNKIVSTMIEMKNMMRDMKKQMDELQKVKSLRLNSMMIF